ncbi:hypothetical protein ACFLWC_06470 [Chloroflexota bacterium]
MLTSPDKFASLFNAKIPGAYRRITTQDVLSMKSCGLIGRSSYYGRADLETVRCILQYEQLWEKRSAQSTMEHKQEPPKCK